MANSHRRRNFIKKIKINGIWFEEEATIRREVVGAYMEFLLDPGGWPLSILGLSFKETESDVTAKMEDLSPWKRFLQCYQT